MQLGGKSSTERGREREREVERERLREVERQRGRQIDRGRVAHTQTDKHKQTNTDKLTYTHTLTQSLQLIHPRSLCTGIADSGTYEFLVATANGRLFRFLNVDLDTLQDCQSMRGHWRKQGAGGGREVTHARRRACTHTPITLVLDTTQRGERGN